MEVAPKTFSLTSDRRRYANHSCKFCRVGDKGRVWQVIRYSFSALFEAKILVGLHGGRKFFITGPVPDYLPTPSNFKTSVI
jgi:hypothetical protein